MKRRGFIKKSGAICLGGAMGVSILTGCSKAYYATYSMDDKKIRIAKTEFVDHDFVLISNERLPAPIYVLKEGEEYSAVLMLCTHLSCEVAPFGSELHCPCHGSEFTNKGEVIEGPAVDSLKKFKVEVNDQYLLIS